MKVDLHTWKKDCIPFLVFQANNAKLAATMRDSFPFPYTLADAEYWIHSNLLIDPPINFAVSAEDQFAGGAGFILKKDIHRKSVEIGYWLGESFWGKGIGSLVIAALVRHIFSLYDVHKIFAEVFSNNPASMRALEKNGFHLEAILKKAIYKNNQFLDAYLWAIFREPASV
jgi:[ribosomal protein S5]-alanine N-acetyltransferase